MLHPSQPQKQAVAIIKQRKCHTGPRDLVFLGLHLLMRQLRKRKVAAFQHQPLSGVIFAVGGGDKVTSNELLRPVFII